MNGTIENNQATIIGTITSSFTFSHEVYGENFYLVNVSVRRMSNEYDVIPVMVSDRLINMDYDYIGSDVRIFGQFRSYNYHEGDGNKLILSLFARELELLSEEDLDIIPQQKYNEIVLDGYICKRPVYRRTPLGREITDLLIAVNRPYGKSDYIPCIVWGRNARFASRLQIGANVELYGRIQSRIYNKKIDNDIEEKTAYEVSVNKIDII